MANRKRSRIGLLLLLVIVVGCCALGYDAGFDYLPLKLLARERLTAASQEVRQQLQGSTALAEGFGANMSGNIACRWAYMDVLLGASESDVRGLIGRYANALVADGRWIQTWSSSKPDVNVVKLERAGIVLEVASITSVDYYEKHTGMMTEAISPAQISAALKENRSVVLLRLSTNIRPWSELECGG